MPDSPVTFVPVKMVIVLLVVATYSSRVYSPSVVRRRIRQSVDESSPAAWLLMVASGRNTD